jgi:hypothetical protein
MSDHLGKINFKSRLQEFNALCQLFNITSLYRFCEQSISLLSKTKKKADRSIYISSFSTSSKSCIV